MDGRRVYPSDPDYPVRDQLEAIRAERTELYHWQDEQEAAKTNGFVYVMRDTRQPGVVKIGKSRDPFTRLSAGRTFCCPRDSLELVSAHYSNNYHELERRVHAYLSSNRVDGEWFKATRALAIKAVLRGKREDLT